MAFLTFITDVGLQKIASEISEGRAWEFTKVKFGSEYSPASEQRTGLTSVQEEFDLAQVSKSGATIVRVEGQPTSAKNYLIKEIGIFITGDTLLAIQANNEGLGSAIAGQKNIFSFDLEIGQVPLDKIQITGPGNNLNLFVAEELMAMVEAHTTMITKFIEQERRITKLENSR